MSLPFLGDRAKIRLGLGSDSSSFLLPVKIDLLPTLLKFLFIGGLGYLIYQAAMFAIYDAEVLPFLPAKETNVRLILFDHSNLRLLIATLISAELSILSVFTGHNIWTFADRKPQRNSLWVCLSQFHLKALISTFIILTSIVNISTEVLNINHYMAIPIGITLAFTWNWLWDSRVIWQQRKLE